MLLQSGAYQPATPEREVGASECSFLEVPLLAELTTTHPPCRESHLTMTRLKDAHRRIMLA
jgi:hypothetical protein